MLQQSLTGETIRSILVTHTHRDHSPGATALRAATGAPIYGCSPYVPAPVPPDADLLPSDAANDRAYAPDRVLADGDVVAGPGYEFVTVATPGHAANHLAFALPQDRALFSGDHVMAWSTTGGPPRPTARCAPIAPRSTSCSAARRPCTGPVTAARCATPPGSSRRSRSTGGIGRRRSCIGWRPATAPSTRWSRGSTPTSRPALKGAAALSVLAHLQELAERGSIVIEGPFGPRGRYRLA